MFHILVKWISVTGCVNVIIESTIVEVDIQAGNSTPAPRIYRYTSIVVLTVTQRAFSADYTVEFYTYMRCECHELSTEAISLQSNKY